jgi:predicted alpha/beta-hydrolase family hydrolase
MAQELHIALTDALAERAGTPVLTALVDEPASAPVANLVFLHGAGLDMRAPFMEAFAANWSALGLRVVRFDQPYMQRAATEGKRRPPDRMPVLLAATRAVAAALRERFDDAPWALAGKSMGARIATLIAAGESDFLGDTHTGAACALVALGYPLHPPTKPQELRTEHFPRVTTPWFVAQGTRDPFGSAAELAPLLESLGAAHELALVDGGDHDFALPARLARSRDDVLAEVAAHAARFVGHHARP